MSSPAAVLEPLVAAERERRTVETDANVARLLAGLPWPVRRVVTKALGR